MLQFERSSTSRLKNGTHLVSMSKLNTLLCNTCTRSKSITLYVSTFPSQRDHCSCHEMYISGIVCVCLSVFTDAKQCSHLQFVKFMNTLRTETMFMLKTTCVYSFLRIEVFGWQLVLNCLIDFKFT